MRSAWMTLFVVAACSAQPSFRARDSDIFLEATYRSAWLGDESWTIRISSSGQVEERIVRRNGNVVRRRRERVSTPHLARLQRVLDEVSANTLPSRLKRAVDDAPEAVLRISKDGMLWEVLAEAPWDQACRGDFIRFARVWNEIVNHIPPSKGCGGGGQCLLCGF